MTPHTLALEACRLLVKSWGDYEDDGGLDVRMMRDAYAKALEALATQQDDPTTLNIGGGER